MSHHLPLEEYAIVPVEIEPTPAATDATANPFRLVVDPAMRLRLRRALFQLIESHDTQLAGFVGDQKLELDSYKEYVELFARSLRESMDSREGVHYLLKSCGFELDQDDINMEPVWRWKK